MYLFITDITHPDSFVVGPGLVSSSPASVRSSASQPAGPYGRLAPPKTVNWAPIAGGGKARHNLHGSL